MRSVAPNDNGVAGLCCRRDWLPPGFVHPGRVELATGHQLRPIRATDVDIDDPAVMGSRESLWARYGGPWGWPPSTMRFEQDRDDLARHERKIAPTRPSTTPCSTPEPELLGCIYIDPPSDDSPTSTDATTSWWVIDRQAGGALETALAEFVPRWLTDVCGFSSVLTDP